MRLFSVLFDWFCQRLFWLCVLAAAGSTVRADVILWGQGGNDPPRDNTPYLIRPGESRTQPFWIDKRFQINDIRLHVQDNPLSSGTGRVTVWLSGESIYSGPAVTRLTGLARELPGGWHYLTVTGLENQSQWVGSAGNAVDSQFGQISSPGLNLQVLGVSLVPEPSMGIAAGVAVCVMGAIGFFRRMRRGNKCSGTR
jgi:hypothetical protein